MLSCRSFVLEQVAQQLASISKNSPLWDATGLQPSADRPAISVCSYLSTHSTLSEKAAGYAEKYKQFVVDYSVEWEKIVTGRIDAGLKKAEQCRRDLDHYQKKVEALRLQSNQTMVKGKSVKAADAEKLGRNEEKLVSAKQTYNKIATDLCILMEEIIERGWRDLHPLLIKCAQFDMTLSSDESKILASLQQVVNTLKEVAVANGLLPQPRLKDLATLNPELISTRPGGVKNFQIESAGPLPSELLSPTSSIGSAPAINQRSIYESTMANPPGTVGAQGKGGFPVQIAPTNSYDFGGSPTSAHSQHPVYRNDTMDSFSSAPPTMQSSALTLSTNSGSMYGGNMSSYGAPMQQQPDPLSTFGMLSISQASAPAPTLHDVYASGYGAGTASAPSTGNFSAPSLTSVNNSNHGYGRSSSFGPAAPAPSAPPPPPPPPPSSMPPYPPRSTFSGSSYAPDPPSGSSMSMYGASNVPPSPWGAPPPVPTAPAMNASDPPDAYSFYHSGPPPRMQSFGNTGVNPFGN
jgi:hypothetical protein